MKLLMMEPTKTIRKHAKYWKELYDILANYGLFRDYSEMESVNMNMSHLLEKLIVENIIMMHKKLQNQL